MTVSNDGELKKRIFAWIDNTAIPEGESALDIQEYQAKEDIFHILNLVKKDFVSVVLFSSFEINNLTESEKHHMKRVADQYCEKIKKWFGEK